MDRNKIITGNFELITYKLTINAINGSVEKSPEKEFYNDRDTVILKAIPDIGYIFITWGGDALGPDTTFKIIMDSDKNVVANFSKLDTGTAKDIDENTYKTITIGNQIWSAQNLRTTRLNDGSLILLDSSSVNWGKDTVAKYCAYDNRLDSTYFVNNGYLYNWYAVKSNKLAPIGWHIPSSAEWDTLQNYLISHGYNWDTSLTENKIAKALSAETGWDMYSEIGTPGNNLADNNKSGFSAVPGGYRYYGGGFDDFGTHAHWWTATETNIQYACQRSLSFGGEKLMSNTNYYKGNGLSIRFIKD